jgi:hypothetical protein
MGNGGRKPDPAGGPEKAWTSEAIIIILGAIMAMSFEGGGMPVMYMAGRGIDITCGYRSQHQGGDEHHTSRTPRSGQGVLTGMAGGGTANNRCGTGP